MPKKKTGKHLRFYMFCMKNDKIMPCSGLCKCAYHGLLNGGHLLLFRPDGAMFTFWASGECSDKMHIMTPLRETIVLFLAAINNEL